MKKNRYILSFGFLVFTPIIYIITTLPQTKVYSFPFLIFFLILTISLVLFKRDSVDNLFYSAYVFVMLLVGVTGWYFSPFFSWIYILAIAMSFLYSVNLSALFVAVLVALFAPNIGSIDAYIDTLNLLSLMFIIPLTFFLRQKYLDMKETEKKILVLKRENMRYKNTVEEVLSNKVIRLGAELREPINDIKQIAYYLQKKETVGKTRIQEQKIILLSGKALDLLKRFEEETTGEKLVKSPVHNE